MCYNIRYLTERKIKYAQRYGLTPEEISQLEKELELIPENKQNMYFVNAMQHPEIPVITNENPDKIQFFKWGLIPFWVKDEASAKKIMKQTVNARGESIFEKPSFRSSARYKRCIVIIDGFFEYHHKNNKTYPFHIIMKNKQPMILAGLWDVWTNKTTGEIVPTVTIITTQANNIMKKIHNNPKRKDSRMPVILKNNEREWLKNVNSAGDLKILKDILSPLPDEDIVAYPVPKLVGKGGAGNTKKAIEKYEYPDLDFINE
ncbi:MAG: SOS response-associated peptidase [Marinilabiliales bacterium]